MHWNKIVQIKPFCTKLARQRKTLDSVFLVSCVLFRFVYLEVFLLLLLVWCWIILPQIIMKNNWIPHFSIALLLSEKRLNLTIRLRNGTRRDPLDLSVGTNSLVCWEYLPKLLEGCRSPAFSLFSFAPLKAFNAVKGAFGPRVRRGTAEWSGFKFIWLTLCLTWESQRKDPTLGALSRIEGLFSCAGISASLH